MTQQWRSGEVLAWTEQDGPGRPPAGPRRWQTAGLAGLTAGVVLGMMFTDTLCPEHRSIVMAFGSIAFVCLVTASIGLWRDWAAAPILSLVASLCGVGIGVIDVTHAAARGSAIAIAFALLAVGSTWLVWRQLVILAWDRQIRRQLARGARPVQASEEQVEAVQPDPVRASTDAAALTAAGRPAAVRRHLRRPLAWVLVGLAVGGFFAAGDLAAERERQRSLDDGDVVSGDVDDDYDGGDDVPVRYEHPLTGPTTRHGCARRCAATRAGSAGRARGQPRRIRASSCSPATVAIARDWVWWVAPAAVALLAAGFRWLRHGARAAGWPQTPAGPSPCSGSCHLPAAGARARLSTSTPSTLPSVRCRSAPCPC